VAQVLLDNGYSTDYVKVLRGGWLSWQSLDYPMATSEVPAGATPGQSNQAPPGYTVVTVMPPAAPQIQIGTPVPGAVPVPATP
jgi:hypothetical protein